MAIRRHFLGWDAPALPRAARWLHDRSGETGVSLSDWTVVVPGRRAARRLIETLIEQAAGHAIEPPRIVTAGQLPELLYTPPRPVAADLAVMLAWLHALRHVPTERLAHVIPHPPDHDDVTACAALARQITLLHETLAADARSFADVAALPEDHAPMQQRRWAALVELHHAYEAALDAMGLVDVHTARAAAVRDRACRAGQPICLIAAVDLNRITRTMLEQVEGDVSALVHAPAELAERFDAFGCIDPEQWIDRPLDLDESQLTIVERPQDEAHSVIRAIDAYRTQHDALRLTDVTIGLGDEAEGPVFQRALELAGLRAHLPAGRPMAQCGPAVLLDVVAAFAQSLRLDDLARLARQADFEDYLAHAAEDDPPSLHLLDLYAADSLQAKLDERWIGSDPRQHRTMQSLYDHAQSLIGERCDERRALPAWSPTIASLLEKAYSHRHLRPFDESDAPVVETLTALGDLLNQQADLEPGGDATPSLTLPQAIRFTLARLSAQTATPDPEDDAVEMLGWLELQLDDAPLLIVTSVNEGRIPGSQSADPFLPDALRARLGLADNARRYARDRMMLEALIASRRDGGRVHLIAARRDGQDNPLTPSRLTLACDPAKLPAWIERFYGRDETEEPPYLLLRPGGRSRFVIPVPTPPNPPVDRLSVTTFRDYLACPYRFYLRHVARLETVDDRLVELDAMAFGNLAHDVLQQFGVDDIADSADVDAIADFLSDRLRSTLRRSYGSDPRPAVLIQAAMLERRLEAFARWQASWRAAGWRVVAELCERKIQRPLDVDGKPFTISGKIDRVDVHDKLGHALLDYKTGESGKDPDKAHRKQGQWVDLQLPLYVELGKAIDIADAGTLGYINLPKRASGTGLAEARWTDADIASAHGAAAAVIRNIRAGVFYPPAEPPGRDDGYGAICMDHADTRGEAIELLKQRVQR